jgi:glutaredoxin 3
LADELSSRSQLNFSGCPPAYNVKPKRIRLFIKPYCGWCHKAIRWLDDHDIEYETVDVIADESAFDEMIRISDQELAPVIDVDGEILADFGPEQLEGFFNKLGKINARA